MLRRKRAAAHVGPEKQQAEHKRNRAEIINRQRGGGSGAQQLRGLLDEVESIPARLSSLRALHFWSIQFTCQSVPS